MEVQIVFLPYPGHPNHIQSQVLLRGESDFQMGPAQLSELSDGCGACYDIESLALNH